MLVTIFALSPVTAGMGDLIRRFGALTQLALLAGAVIGALVVARYGGGSLARLFWIAGLVVSAIALLQQARLYPTISPTYYPVRSSSVIGYPTYLGGWIYLCVLTCVVYAPFRARWYKQAIWWLGIAFIATALIPSGARTATLALGAGIFTGVLLLAATRGWRWILLLIAVGALASVIILPHLIGLEGIPLFQRLDLTVSGNATQDLRLSIWDGARAMLDAPPTLADVNGAADRWSALRPLVGYGWDMQEVLFDRIPTLEFFAVDRAHNFWLDLLLTGGWSALLVRGGLTIGIGLWALRRLRLLRPRVILPAVLGIVAGGILALNSVWLPVIATYAGIVGLWLGLLLEVLVGRRGAPAPADRPAWLALMVGVAFLVDMQLGFETVIVSFTYWLVTGGIFARAEPANDASDSPLPIRFSVGMVALGGAALLRQIAFNAPSAHASSVTALVTGAVLIGGLAYLLWLEKRRITPRDMALGVLAIGAFWLFGWRGGGILPPNAAALWEVVFFSVGSALFSLTYTEHDAPSRLPARRRIVLPIAGLIVLAALTWWVVDTTGDSALRQGNILIPQAPTWQQSERGVALRFWDERAWLYTAMQLLNVADSADDADSRSAVLARASDALVTAARLHPFDPQLPPQLDALKQSEAAPLMK